MLLVADSGSTKVDWILTLPDKRTLHFRTKGINPFFLSEKEIVQIFYNTEEIKGYLDEVREIYFFGAGCSSPDQRELISNALSRVFKNAFVSVDVDITASIYATCGSSEGICCILGTGSNICYFDGTKIHDSNHGLGFVLGDEGSGTWFGRKLITSYLYGTMPIDLSRAFHQKYDMNKDIVIKRVYQESSPNSFMASFAPFMSEHIDHPFIITLLKEGFEDFVETHIMSYPRYRDIVCHFVGSIAFHFSDSLIEVCNRREIRIGKILKHPIDELSIFIASHGIINL